MNDSIKTVALCSPTGKFGPFLLEALKAQGFVVTAILRESSKATFPPEQKVTRLSDEFREDELVTAFSGHDAVVLSLSFELLAQSKKFAQASIKAGNRWLIASTYGPNLQDPEYALFPASVPHYQAVQELRELQQERDDWSWTAISCGPWPELSAAAGAWKIDPAAKTAELVDGGKKVFTSSTRRQVARAAARVLAKQPASMRNQTIFVASFEVPMLTWLNAYKEIVGSDGWTVTSVTAEEMAKRSQAQLAAGDFANGYMGTALVVCTGEAYQNHYSSFTELANKELELPEEDLLAVLKEGMALPNPFA
ncbi:hypothetical protein G7054_g4044 [Neopestalotiopsis clavispora]|nr:hypothetical protein G7054_g4044 [Neopestalotiopsis clavispora]